MYGIHLRVICYAHIGLVNGIKNEILGFMETYAFPWGPSRPRPIIPAAAGPDIDPANETCGGRE